MRVVIWALQILILTAGIHLFLRFVRTTRGNRLIRGLFLSVIVGVVGLWGLSRALGLEELEHLLRGSSGFIVVGFVVIFQSELRRGIAQLGEHPFIGRLMQSSDGGVLRESVQAAHALSRRRQGALIAFERETPLTPYLETGTRVDAEVRAPLLETLFHPETPLHDGAVIVRRGRVASAGCILPLSEELLPSPTMGTRHRAALGLSEESDAIVLVVSEETGSISIARAGTLCSDLPAEELQRELENLVQSKGSTGAEPRGPLAVALHALRRDLVWLPGSLLLALGIFYIAHQGLQETAEFSVRFVDSQGREKGPKAEEVLVLLPGEHDQLVNPGQAFRVEVTGTRRQLDELGGAVRGVLRIAEPDWEGGPVSTGDVRWEDPVGGLRYAWKDQVPELATCRYETRAFELSPETVEIDVGRMNPRLQLYRAGLRFEPSASVEISGPLTELEKLAGFLSPRLEPLHVTPEDHGELRRRVHLHPDLSAAGLTLASEVAVIVPLLPVAREIGTISREIALVCLDPERQDEVVRWSLPPHARSARFAVHTLGLIPQDADPSSPAMIERIGTIRRFVEENLRVFVDVAELDPESESRSARVRWAWRASWQDWSGSRSPAGIRGTHEELDVVLQSDPEILLEPESPLGSSPNDG